MLRLIRRAGMLPTLDLSWEYLARSASVREKNVDGERRKEEEGWRNL
jgi:hypothetical protein